MSVKYKPTQAAIGLHLAPEVANDVLHVAPRIVGGVALAHLGEVLVRQQAVQNPPPEPARCGAPVHHEVPDSRQNAVRDFFDPRQHSARAHALTDQAEAAGAVEPNLNVTMRRVALLLRRRKHCCQCQKVHRFAS